MRKTLIGWLFGMSLVGTLLSCSEDSASKSLAPENSSVQAKTTNSLLELAVTPALESLACKNLRDQLFEGLQEHLDQYNSIPRELPRATVISEKLNIRFVGALSAEKIAKISELLQSFYDISLNQVPKAYGVSDPVELKRVLGSLRVGDRSISEAEKFQLKYSSIFQELKLQIAATALKCTEFSTLETKQNLNSLSEIQVQAKDSKTPLAILGLRRAFATAYQSCESLRLPPMNRSTLANEGVVVTGPYPGGGGDMRKITDQEALSRTHYYVKDFSEQPGCINVKKQTMIYDYGGKPYSTSADKNTLNYWKNNGDGSPGLGIDCSGYVFSSLAAGGLRLIKGKQLKASEVENYPARMYINAANNGFTCLESAKVGKNYDLRPGDIVATKYHILMIESVGRDPLAIRKYSDCNRISYTDFDFVIAHSSPEQNAVGINKYEAKDYLAQKIFNPIQWGFVSFARAACEAYQQNKDVAPSTSSFGVTRHKMTAECLQPELKLVGSACIDSCTELYSQ